MPVHQVEAEQQARERGDLSIVRSPRNDNKDEPTRR
jgi:hypothetical protein